MRNSTPEYSKHTHTLTENLKSQPLGLTLTVQQPQCFIVWSSPHSPQPVNDRERNREDGKADPDNRLEGLWCVCVCVFLTSYLCHEVFSVRSLVKNFSLQPFWIQTHTHIWIINKKFFTVCCTTVKPYGSQQGD